jgi:hypothetical protein
VVVFAFNAALTIYSNLVQKKKIEKLEKSLLPHGIPYGT